LPIEARHHSAHSRAGGSAATRPPGVPARNGALPAAPGARRAWPGLCRAGRL